MEKPLENKRKLNQNTVIGSLAIDLGNSTTVVAFQGENDSSPILLNLPPISRETGEIPSLIWLKSRENHEILLGQQVINLNLKGLCESDLISDFKRWIGAPNRSQITHKNLTPEKAGELLIQTIWQLLPPELIIKRLILTAPIETYRGYRAWLHSICKSLPVQEVALVDEPTAAALGAGLPSGSKLLVVDLGGSTIDMSLVGLEGGEGRAEPVAQLLKFQGQDLEKTTKQTLRCAKVLGKAGQRLGGRDLDRWIANYLHPNVSLTEELLNTAEKLKCKLSNESIKESELILEVSKEHSESNYLELALSRIEFEELLIKKGFLNCLENLLKQTLAKGRSKGCSLADLKGVVIVGGGSRIPIIRKWLKEAVAPAPLLTPPPIEAVVKGALILTPGVRILDILNKGVSLRLWDQRSNAHCWYPIFFAGQPWPTTNPLEIILAASKNNQSELELVIGETSTEGDNEIVYINNLPTIKAIESESKVVTWENKSILIPIEPHCKKGEDCFKLNFSINSKCELMLKGIDLLSGNQLETKNLGSIR